jgi:hypothetical protein
MAFMLTTLTEAYIAHVGTDFVAQYLSRLG